MSRIEAVNDFVSRKMDESASAIPIMLGTGLVHPEDALSAAAMPTSAIAAAKINNHAMTTLQT